DDAPPVTYPVGRTLRLAGLLAGLWLAGVAAVFYALISAPALIQKAPAAISLIASVAFSGAACWMFWRSQSPRSLVWDGARWGLESEPDDATRLHVRMDLQHVMLLCLEAPPARRPVWLWAEAAHDAARWHLLRCALYSSALSVAAEPATDERA
ncbi:hypothetical protein, partial [Ottowia sp.]|uniref:hypothetical protein n=1 Tax=Ottowia sp. TaxID=1898956 RepID=UPI0039E3FD47